MTGKKTRTTLISTFAALSMAVAAVADIVPISPLTLMQDGIYALQNGNNSDWNQLLTAHASCAYGNRQSFEVLRQDLFASGPGVTIGDQVQFMPMNKLREETLDDLKLEVFRTVLTERSTGKPLYVFNFSCTLKNQQSHCAIFEIEPLVAAPPMNYLDCQHLKGKTH